MVTWNIGGRIPENTAGFVGAKEGGKAGGFGSLMGSVPMAGIFGDEGGRGSKGEAVNHVARMSGAFGGLVGSVSTGAGGFIGSVTKGAGLATASPSAKASAAAEWSARASVVTWNIGGRIPENTAGFVGAKEGGKAGGFGSLIGSVPMAGIFGDEGRRGSKGDHGDENLLKSKSITHASGVFGGFIFGDGERGPRAAGRIPGENFLR